MKVCNRYVLGCVGFCNPVKDQSESISRPTRSGWGAAASGQKLAVWPQAPNVYEKFIRVDPARIHCPIPPTQSLDNSHEYSSLDKQKWGNIFVYLHLLWLVVTFARLLQVGWVVLNAEKHCQKQNEPTD